MFGICTICFVYCLVHLLLIQTDIFFCLQVFRATVFCRQRRRWETRIEWEPHFTRNTGRSRQPIRW